MGKSLLIRSIALGFVLGVILFAVAMPKTINADLKNVNFDMSKSTFVKNGHLTVCKVDALSFEVVKKIKMIVTAYSSTPDQTDDTPFITASGKPVAEDIIANNLLAFGTKVRIPEIYGDKILTVGDRMHARMGLYHADLWFPTRDQAKEFGAKYNVTIEVLES
jgi:3D (Asp-Asp-Asp) domain-containing protein